MKFFLQQLQYLRDQVGWRLSLLVRGPDPHLQPERNIWHLYQDVLWAGFMGVANTFASVFAIRLGASNTWLGFLSSIPSLIVILLRFPAARLVEGQGRLVPFIARSLLAARLGYLLIALMPFAIQSHQAEALILLLIFMGLPANFANAGWDTLFADVVPMQDRARVVSMRNIIANFMAILLVPLAGKWLDWAPFTLGYQVLFATAFVGGVLSTHHVSRIQAPNRTVEKKGAKLLSWRDMTAVPGYSALLVAIFVYQWAMSLPSPLYNIYFVRYLGASDAWIGLRSMLASITPLVAFRFWPRLIDRWGEWAVLVLFTPLTMLFPLLTGAFRSLTPQLFIIAGLGLLNPGIQLARYNMLLRICPEARRPTYIAGYAIVANIAAFLAPLSGVRLLNLIGINNVFFLAAAIRLAGALLFQRLPPGPKRPTFRLRARLSFWRA